MQKVCSWRGSIAQCQRSYPPWSRPVVRSWVGVCSRCAALSLAGERSGCCGRASGVERCPSWLPRGGTSETKGAPSRSVPRAATLGIDQIRSEGLSDFQCPRWVSAFARKARTVRPTGSAASRRGSLDARGALRRSVYLNRLSDLLFVIARALTREHDRSEVYWDGGARDRRLVRGSWAGRGTGSSATTMSLVPVGAG